MQLVRESIMVATAIGERLELIAAVKGDGITVGGVAIQCIDLLHNLNCHWRANRRIYQEDELLPLLPPKLIGLKPERELALNIYPPQQESLKQICSNNRIDKQSAISYALDCMQIIDDALLNHRLYASAGTGFMYPFKVGWIRLDTSP